MSRILDITAKDLLQLLRDRKVFIFLLIMPLAFTLLFGFAFGGFSHDSDSRLPVGYLDQDASLASRKLYDLLAASQVIRLVKYPGIDRLALETLVADEKLAAAIVVPPRYGHTLLRGERPRLILIGDTSSSAGTTIQSEALASSIRLENSVRIARVFEQVAGERQPFDFILEEALAEWQEPPISVRQVLSEGIQSQGDGVSALAHTSPGFMLQFAIAGLLASAQIIVSERKIRALQRLLTTATARLHILLGHFLAIFTLIFCQFLALISFGQFVLKVDYLRDPLATLLVAFTAALCIAALGLLIGTLARTEEQAIIFSLIPMFVLAGLGGAWVPLEVTGAVFSTIGHLSPIAWAMDGFKDVTIRGLGLASVLLPSAALLTYAALFFALASWRFRTE